MTPSDMSLKIAAVSQRARAYSHAPSALQDAVVSMSPGCLLDDLATDEQRAGAWKVLDWIDQFLIPPESKHG